MFISTLSQLKRIEYEEWAPTLLKLSELKYCFMACITNKCILVFIDFKVCMNPDPRRSISSVIA